MNMNPAYDHRKPGCLDSQVVCKEQSVSVPHDGHYRFQLETLETTPMFIEFPEYFQVETSCRCFTFENALNARIDATCFECFDLTRVWP